MSDNSPFDKAPNSAVNINEYKTLKSERYSVPFIHRPENLFTEEDDASIESPSLNDRLLGYKEIKMLYKKTGIPPIYFLLLLIALLLVVLVGYFEDHLTILLGSLYPIYISIKALQYSSKDDIKKWLCYWYLSSK